MDDKEKDTERREEQPQDEEKKVLTAADDAQPAADGAAETTAEPQKSDEAPEKAKATDSPTQKKAPSKAKDKKGGISSSVLGNKTIEDVIQREAKEEQDTSSPFSLPKTLGGVMIARAFQKQIGLVCLVAAFLIIYINNRYVCQKRMVEIDKIERKMVEARYKATVCTSILTEKSRESNIMKLLGSYGDSTLTIPNEPPYLIRVEE